MAGFEVAIFFDKLAVLDDGATNAGGEGEIKTTAGTVASFGEAGEIGVVFDIDGEMEIVG